MNENVACVHSLIRGGAGAASVRFTNKFPLPPAVAEPTGSPTAIHLLKRLLPMFKGALVTAFPRPVNLWRTPSG